MVKKNVYISNNNYNILLTIFKMLLPVKMTEIFNFVIDRRSLFFPLSFSSNLKLFFINFHNYLPDRIMSMKIVITGLKTHRVNEFIKTIYQ